MIKRILFGVCFLLFLTSLSFAVPPFLVDDPTIVSTSAQVELSYGEIKISDWSGYYTGVGLKLLLIPKTLQLGTDKDFFHSPEFQWGNGDSLVNLKYAVLENTALKFSVKTTDGDEVNGYGDEFTEMGCTLLQKFSVDNYQLYTNIGYNFYNNVEQYSEDIGNHWQLGVGVQVPLLTDLDLCAEVSRIFAVRRYIDADDSAIDSMVGVRWVINGVPFDASYRFIPTQKSSILSGGIYFDF